MAKKFNLTALCILTAYFFYHLKMILKYAVDLPYWDEWDMLRPNALNDGFDPAWLFSQHTDHRIIFTKLYIWLLYRINGWNLMTNEVINFFIFAIVLGSLFWICKKAAPQISFWILSPFFLFCLSPLLGECHTWAFESQFHFMLLFSFLTIIFMFSPAQNLKSFSMASLGLVMSVFSLSGGITTVAGSLFIFVIFQFLQKKYRNALALSLVYILAIVVWTIGYVKPTDLPPKTLFYKIEFWNFFVNLISFGFGIEWIFWPLGLFCLCLILVPFVWATKNAIKNPNRLDLWTYIAVITSLLFTLMTITVGRAAWGVQTSKTMRYAEFGVMFLPLVATGWWLLLTRWPKARALFLAFFCLFCAMTFKGNWHFDYYQLVHERQERGLKCIWDFYQGRPNPDGLCRMALNHPIGPYLERAKNLNLSFYKKGPPSQAPQQ